MRFQPSLRRRRDHGEDRSKSSQPPLRPSRPTSSQPGIENPSTISLFSHSCRSRSSFVPDTKMPPPPYVLFLGHRARAVKYGGRLRAVQLEIDLRWFAAK